MLIKGGPGLNELDLRYDYNAWWKVVLDTRFHITSLDN